MPGQRYEQVTVTGTGPNALGQSLVVWRALDATGPQLTCRPWYRCGVCGLDFPEDKVRRFRGKYYGIPCSDYKDIAQLAQRRSK